MEIDLLKIYEQNKIDKEKQREIQNNINERQEINRIISSIIDGDEEYESFDEKLIKKIGIKYKKTTHKRPKTITGFVWKEPQNEYYNMYNFKLNKQNVLLIQKYIKNNK